MVYLPQPVSTRTSSGLHHHLESSHDLHRGSVQKGVAVVKATRNERSGQCPPSVKSQ